MLTESAATSEEGRPRGLVCGEASQTSRGRRAVGEKGEWGRLLQKEQPCDQKAQR